MQAEYSNGCVFCPLLNCCEHPHSYMAGCAGQASATMSLPTRLRQLAELVEAATVSHAELVTHLSGLAQQLATGDAPTKEQLSSQEQPETPADPVEDTSAEQPASKKRKKAPRAFDFSLYRRRYVALELMYVGSTYQGFARQDGTDNTIEGALFAALRRTRLIPETAEISSLMYSRCGRTDKGVSALGQVVALTLRSSARVVPPNIAGSAAAPAQSSTKENAPDNSNGHAAGICVTAEAGASGQQAVSGHQPDKAQAAAAARAAWQQEMLAQEADLPPPDQELEYPRLINRALPSDIRVLGWTPVHPTFNARFSARWREYKYFIVDRDGCLDIAAMQQAAQMFVGEHDFRNFCKPDILAVKSFIRTIHSFSLELWGVQSHLSHTQPANTQTPAAAGLLQGSCAQAAADACIAAAHRASLNGSMAAEMTLATNHMELLPPTDTGAAAAGGGQASLQVATCTVLSPARQSAVPQEAFQQGDLQQQPAVVHQEGDVVRHDHSQVYAFTVRGSAFLWHQVRCMVAVLLMVGQRLEPPHIVSRLLDIKATPCKPCYPMASEEPLLLYACGFEGLSFIRSNNLASELAAHVRTMSESHLIAASLTGAIAARLGGDADQDAGGGNGAGSGSHERQGTGKGQAAQKGPAHVPLLKRPTEMNIEERAAKHGVVLAQLGDSHRSRAGQDEDVEME